MNLDLSNRPSRQSTRGFTLVELLVVIGIIALLISILLPTLGRARSSANSIACQSNLRQVGLGLLLYADGNKQSLPRADERNLATGNAEQRPYWSDHVAAYIGVKGDGDATSGFDQSKYGEAFTCPDAKIPGGWMHYSVHPRLIPPQAGWVNDAKEQPWQLVTLDSGSTKLTMQPYKLAQIPRPTELMLAADASQYRGEVSQPWFNSNIGNAYPAMLRLNSSSIFWNQFTDVGDGFVPLGLYTNFDGVAPGPETPVKFQSGTPNLESLPFNSCGPRFRHFDDTKVNALFVDGHVDSRRLNEVSTNWPGEPDGGELQQKNVMIYRD